MKQIKTTPRDRYEAVTFGGYTLSLHDGIVVRNAEREIVTRKDAPHMYAYVEACELVKRLPESWEIGFSEFDRHSRGHAVNWALYSFGMYEGKRAYVIQVRTWEKRSKNGWANVTKEYYIIRKSGRGVEVIGKLTNAARMNAAIRLQKPEKDIFAAAVKSLAKRGEQ